MKRKNIIIFIILLFSTNINNGSGNKHEILSKDELTIITGRTCVQPENGWRCGSFYGWCNDTCMPEGPCNCFSFQSCVYDEEGNPNLSGCEFWIDIPHGIYQTQCTCPNDEGIQVPVLMGICMLVP